MELNVTRHTGRFINKYEFYDEYSHLVHTGTRDSDYYFNLRKFSIKDINENILCYLKERNRIEKILRSIPIISVLSIQCPCDYYENDIKYKILFKTKSFCAYIILTINGISYKIILHRNNGNKISIYQNDLQVALIIKEMVNLSDYAKYKIIYNAKIESKLVALFCIYADDRWFDANSSDQDYEWGKTIFSVDEQPFNSDWKPEKL